MELYDENIAAKYLDATCDELRDHRYTSMVLSRQEALCGIKLSHCPDSRHAENAVLYRQLRDISVLLEEGNQNFVSEQRQDCSWSNHEQSVDQTCYVQILSTQLAHLVSKPLCLLEVERCSICLRYQGFQRPVEPLTDSKAKNTNDDVGKADALDESCCILLGVQVVVACQRNEEGIYDH